MILKNTGINSLSCILIMKRKECTERNDIHAYVKVSHVRKRSLQSFSL